MSGTRGVRWPGWKGGAGIGQLTSLYTDQLSSPPTRGQGGGAPLTGGLGDGSPPKARRIFEKNRDPEPRAKSGFWGLSIALNKQNPLARPKKGGAAGKKGGAAADLAH